MRLPTVWWRMSSAATFHASCACYHALNSAWGGINRGIVSNAAAPFGGIKQSGLGREGSREGLHEYQDVVYAAFNT